MAITMDQQIIAVIDALCAKFGIAIDWTSVNVVPELQHLFEKYISWELVTSIILLIGGIILLVISVWLAIQVFRRQIPEEALLVVALLASLGGAAVATQMFEIVACITFPEKFILDYIKSMIATG